MKKSDLIVKHLNALISKYQLEIDLLTEMKKKPTNELHQAEIDINIKYFEEEIKEIQEVKNSLDKLSVYIDYFEENSLLFAPSGVGKPIIKNASQKELIKDAETLLNEFKQANNDSSKFEVEQKATGQFFTKYYESFPLFCVIFSRTVSSHYSIEVSEKFLEFLGQLDYEEASNKIDLWIGDNNPKKVNI
ncbi:hypothetical protein [Chryseobacterium oncorhynchi]|uniref:Uncharacterized protein n=1 Tax=Chryseobacterium oncorhynchi TaxID=741074 RepID=A0A316WDU9_9FLAO|nr:hypothetical protein [Chryseobacterium oncorhynchi]PWN59219.1 hypothetical protein C1638_021670 [Chryseobacterium oncorhynchi]